jgi:hypothetical protein
VFSLKINKFDPVMKKLVARRFFIALVAVGFMAVLFSSCNRGYGCPYKMTAKVEAKK